MSHDWTILWPNSRFYRDDVILYWLVDKHRPGLSIKQNCCASLYLGDEHKKKTSQILVYILIVESDFVLCCRYFLNQVVLKGEKCACTCVSYILNRKNFRGSFRLDFTNEPGRSSSHSAFLSLLNIFLLFCSQRLGLVHFEKCQEKGQVEIYMFIFVNMMLSSTKQN